MAAASSLSPSARALYARLDVPKQDWGKPSGAAICFAHALTVPAGPFVNKPLRLRPFQFRFIRSVYNALDPASGRRKVRQAVLSIARRNGKTLMAAVMILLHLAGPFKRPNSTLCSAATTRKQAGIVFRFVRDIIRANSWLKKRLRIVDSTKHIIHREDGSVYEAISAEAGGQFGEGLDFCVYDEFAQAKNRQLYDALMTSLGSQVEPLMMIISTQAANDNHPLSELIDYGEKINAGVLKDDSFVCQLHTVPKSAKLTDSKQWAKANPGLDDYRDRKELRDAIKRAVAIPSQESSVRVYYLNQRVRAEAAFLSPDVWAKNAGPIMDHIFKDGRPVYGGLDLSSRVDLTGFSLACEDDDQNVHLKSYGWTPGNTIEERALRDRAPYDAWARAGLLFAPPGNTIGYDFVAMEIAEITQGMNLVRIAYDRWMIKRFKEDCARLGIALPLAEFGQGYRDMSPAVAAFEALALDGKLRHADHPVLKWCVSNTVITRDPAGSRKPDKSKTFGRIDLCVAAIQAVAAMKTQVVQIAEPAAMIA